MCVHTLQMKPSKVESTLEALAGWILVYLELFVPQQREEGTEEGIVFPRKGLYFSYVSSASSLVM